VEYALIGKLVVEAVAAAAVLVAALMFLKDRRSARAAELRDRAAERASLTHLVDNAIAHNTAAIEANSREQRAAAEALARLAASLDALADRLASRPCLREKVERGA
jgi:hypothetical protein